MEANKNAKVLVLDDEPHLLDWLREYLEGKGLVVTNATNVPEALAALDEVQFRFLILDLNVPSPPHAIAEGFENHTNYPGLIVAEYARNLKAYRGRQVIVYSVHDHEDVRAVAQRIAITYCLKGRPRQFKAELDQVLSFDPMQSQKKETRG